MPAALESGTGCPIPPRITTLVPEVERGAGKRVWGPSWRMIRAIPSISSSGSARGDRQALTDLFQRHRDRLRRMVALRLDARLQGRVDASDVLQDAFLDAAARLDSYLQGSELPAFLWLRLVVGERLSIYHRRHLGTKMRDARPGGLALPRPVAPGQLGRPGLDAAGPAHVSLARGGPGRARARGAGGAQRARPPGPGGGRPAKLRAAYPRRNGAGARDHRGRRCQAVYPGPQTVEVNPGARPGGVEGL